MYNVNIKFDTICPLFNVRFNLNIVVFCVSMKPIFGRYPMTPNIIEYKLQNILFQSRSIYESYKSIKQYKRSWLYRPALGRII